jgi:hypothetical protein
MKIAICLAGQLRTGVDASASLLRYIGDLLPHCDFFIHTWDVETYSSEGFSCSRYDELGLLPNQAWPVSNSTLVKYVEILNPKRFVLGSFKQWEEMDNRPSHDPHLYSVRQTNNLKSAYETEHNFKYGVVLRTRPDLIYDSKKSLADDIADLEHNDRTFCYSQCFDTTVFANKIDNAFWIGSSYVMDQVSNFELIRGNMHPQFEMDGFMHFGNWVTLGLGFAVKKLSNSKIAVYREFHKDLKKDPIKDFEFIFKTIGRH